MKPQHPKSKKPSGPIGLGPEWAWLESTFLKLPFFTLATKNRHSIDVLAISGKTREGREYSVRIGRNVETPYPGPLSRRVHIALMALLAAQGRPWRNPVTFSWGDLFRQMGLEKGGQNIVRCKDAIRATRGAVIRCSGLVPDKEGGFLSAEVGLNLYERYYFAEWKQRDGGRTLEENEVWLADWYLDKLEENQRRVNVQFWQQFEKRSSIASRLYELLLFYGQDIPDLNYTTLASLLPIKVERYRANARKQLEPALNFLRMGKVISDYRWADSKSDPVGKLILTRGDAAQLVGDVVPALMGLEEGAIVTEELQRTPAELLVVRFYQNWLGAEAKPTAADLEFANKLIEDHGQETATRLVTVVLPILRANWPEAKTFVAVEKYIPEAAKAEAKAKASKERKAKAEVKTIAELREAREQKAHDATISEAWARLSDGERQAAREAFREKYPRLAGHSDVFVRPVWYRDAHDKKGAEDS